MRKITNLCFVFLVCFNISVFSQFIENKGQIGGGERQNHTDSNVNHGFEENKGQIFDEDGKFRSDVYFVSNISGASVFFTNEGVVFYFKKIESSQYDKILSERIPNPYSDKEWEDIMQQITNDEYQGDLIKRKGEFYRIDINFPSATFSKPVGGNEMLGKRNYFNPQHPEGLMNVPIFESIRYNNVYSGIDLVFYIKSGKLKYDFEISAGADPSLIKILYKGHENITIDEEGNAVVKILPGKIIENTPLSFQNGEIIESEFIISNDTIMFQLGKYDSTQPITIDPSLTWSTYFYDGSNSAGFGYTNPVWDSKGNMFIVQNTYNNTNFPVINPGGAYTQTGGSTGLQLTIMKFNTNKQIVWSTYYASSQSARVKFTNQCATIDKNDNLYIIGSVDYVYGGIKTFPLQDIGSGAYYETEQGNSRNFILKFTSEGTRLWATMFNKTSGTSSSGLEFCGITIDNNNKLVITGETYVPTSYSWNYIPLANPGGSHYYKSTSVEASVPTLHRFSTSGVLEWSTYIAQGTAGAYNGNYSAIDIDANNNIFIGGSGSGSYTTVNSGGAYVDGLACSNGRKIQIFKFASNGALNWCTLYGGTSNNSGAMLWQDCRDLKVAPNGDVILVGRANASDFPWYNPGGGAYYKNTLSSGSSSVCDGVILQFSNSGVRKWATYCGGDGTSDGTDFWGLGIDGSNNIFVSGSSRTTNTFPTQFLAGSYNQPTQTGDHAVVLAQFNISGVKQWASYFGNKTWMSCGGFGLNSTGCGVTMVQCGVLDNAYTITTVDPGAGAYFYSDKEGTSGQTDFIAEFVNVIPLSPPTSATASPNQVCSGVTTDITLTAIGGDPGSGGEVQWFTSSCGGTPIGTGNPLTVSQSLSSSTTYYVRYSGVCGTTDCVSTIVNVDLNITANFTQLGPYCQGDTPDALPTTSTNGISGTWAPVSISTMTSGTGTYTFTPTLGQCAANTTMTITVNPLPTITCPSDFNVTDCNDVIPAGATTTTAFITLGGTTNAMSISSVDGVPSMSGCTETTVRTYTATLLGCTNTCTQNLTRTVDNIGPIHTVTPTDITYACSGEVPVAIATAVNATDICSTVVDFDVNDVITPGICANKYTITRTWTTEDACGNTSTSSQLITVNDNIAPVITGTIADQAANAMGSCIYQVPDVTGLVTATDNCTAIPTLTITQLPLAGTSITANTVVTISVSDECGNISTTSVNITVPTTLTASITALVNQNCLTSGSATVTASGGTPNYTYTWPAAAGSVSGGTASSLNVGNYIVTITDNNGCSTTQTVSIIDDGGLNVSSSVVSDISCNGNNNGQIGITITGGTPNYTINWGTGNTTTSNLTYTITALSAATYDITVTDMHGCQVLTNAIISEPTELIASSSATTISCNGQTADVTVGATGGTTPYTGTGTFTVNAGTHNYTVTDANGCSSVTSITVSEPLLLEASAISTNILCNGETSQITISATGGTTPYTGTGTFTVNAGTHNYTVTDANGCTDNVSVTITEPTELNSSITALVNQNCLTSGSATVTASGGTPNYTYTWPAAAGSVSGGTASSLNVGNYIVTITDNNGCSTTQTVSIIDDGGLNVSSSVISNVSCNGNNNGQIGITITGGTPNYTINWGTGNATTSNLTYTITALSAATYDITVTDMHGCQVLTNAIISEPTELIASSSATTISCNGQTADVTVSATGGTTPYTGTGTFTVNAGTYNYTVTDANGCSSVTSITVSEPLLLEASAISTNILCNGETSQVTINATGGTTPYTGTGTFTVNAGTHNYTVTDANGCTDNVSVTITEPQQLSMTIDVDNVICYGESNGSALANVSGGTMPIQYLWSDDNHSTTASINFMPAGFYTLTVSDQNGCQIIETIQIQQSPQLTVSCNATPIVCEVTLGSVIATADGGSGGFSYWWSNAENSSQISNLTEGNYEVTVTDSGGCTATNTASVDIQGHINLTITQTHPISCFGDNDAVLIANAPLAANPIDYLWSNNYTTDIISNIGAGFYTVSATDNWGCTGYASYDLNEPGQIQVSMSSTPVLCYGSNEGSASAIAFSGSVPYSYLWSNNEISNTITDLYSGLYLVTVTDNNNCSVTAQIDVPQPENPLNMTLTINGISCYGENSGSLNTQAYGGTPPYTYFWQYDQFTSTNSNINNLYAAEYNLLITDKNKCSIDTIASIFEPSAIDATYTYTRPTCIGNNNGSIEINVVGGTFPYLFSWNGGASPVNYLDGLTQGTYLVTITDANQCIYELRSVMIEDIDEDCIKIPNAFTPNTDGINDTWIIENIEMFPDAYINVFNRWGQQLYAGRGNSDPWNGTYNGKFVPTGSYIYTVDLYRSGQTYNGIVTIVY